MARVLIVDDAAFMRKLLNDTLDEAGQEVVGETANGPESKVLESVEAGARDFIVKPFNADRVVEAVSKALA